MRGDVEVQPTGDGRWRIIIQGTYETRDAAAAAARVYARKLRSEFFIRGLLGRLLRRDSHGPDPRDIPG